ncbi:MAG: LptF/LptG family permease, partial [Alteriqipengyuania sp.]
AEYNLHELLQIGWSDNASEDTRNASQASLNYMLVELAMMAFLPLLAVALAIPPKRSTSALGVFVAVVLVVAYHKINQYMQDFAALGRIDPTLGLWGPFVVFVGLILWWFWQIAYVPGGQPIGALESVFSKLVKRLGRILRPRRRRANALAEQAS